MKITETVKVENTSDPGIIKKTLANGATIMEPKQLDLAGFQAHRKAFIESKEATTKAARLEGKVEKLTQDINDIKTMLTQLLRTKK